MAIRKRAPTNPAIINKTSGTLQLVIKIMLNSHNQKKAYMVMKEIIKYLVTNTYIIINVFALIPMFKHQPLFKQNIYTEESFLI